MRWVTRDRIKVDRVACPWLILRFIDAEADFVFVPAKEVDGFAQTTGALPFDVAGADIGHHGDRCSFDALLDKYELDDPALRRLALIVRGADTDARHLCPEARRVVRHGGRLQRTLAVRVSRRSRIAARGVSGLRRALRVVQA
ncbi:MAG TPA: chromate resistance protein ChrB domain-containing protein [Candidatus Eremiobacteraceae bacterium]